MAITRAKSNLVVCTEQSHNQKIRGLWEAFGLKDPSIASSKLPQQSELAKENIAPNAQETKARIAELKCQGISKEEILRILGPQSQQKNESVCAGGGGKARALKVCKPPQSSSPQPLLELCEAYYQEEPVESIVEVPEDVKKLINWCFGIQKQNLTRFLKKMLEKCTSARVLKEALKLNINGSTMESFLRADEDRCHSFMMAIHELDEKSFSENHKYRVLRDWFNQNDEQLDQLIGLLCSDFVFYNGKLSRLISKNAPPSKQNLWQPFQGIKSKLSAYLSHVEVLPPDIKTPLILAISEKDYRLLSALIKIGADLEREVDTLGCTPLNIAICLENNHALELLLENKADVDKGCALGNPPLIYAITSGNIRALELLLEKKADVDKGCACGNTPLIYAIEFDNIPALEILLKTGVNIDKGNNDGETPILKAIQCENFQALQLLIDAGANVHQSESKGFNALDFATRQKYEDGIKLLLGAKADPNRLYDDKMPLIKNAILNNNTTVLKLLLNGGADPNLLCKYGVSSLIAAIQQNQLIDVDLLLQAKANPNFSFKDRSPLILAIETNQVENLQLLQSAGADLNQTDDLGNSPLIYAVKGNHQGAVKLLITGGANVDQQNSLGQTPLDFAIEMKFSTNQTEVLELLLQAGAKPKLSSVHGISPLMLAIETNQVERPELLSEAGAKLDEADDFLGGASKLRK